MQAIPRPSNEAEEIERAEQAVELSKRELNRRLELARQNGVRLLEKYRARLKPIGIGVAVAVGVVAIGAAVLAVARRKRSGWVLPATSRASSSIVGRVLKTAGLWLLRRALTYAVNELVEHSTGKPPSLAPTAALPPSFPPRAAQ